MCQKYLNALKEHWPDLPEEDYGQLLWGATAYPFACGETTARQIKEMAEKSGCDVGVACGIADKELDAAMQAIKADMADDS